MDDTTLTLAAGGLVLVGVAFVLVQAQQQDPTEADYTEPDTNTNTGIIDTVISTARNALGLWHPPEKYAQAIAAAEARYNLPPDMLARLLWQESRYRADVISGATRSPAGALGIAQFMPATAREMGIDPLDPFQAIDGAGRYLAGLYRQFGTWSEALAAYNWGRGNVARRGLGAAPAETRNYYAQILGDLNASNGTNLA